ncbi:MAG: VOC family protein [Verrucomicrobiales bacterium]|nr:VOC family protein [Verrucomicrobiales bacterium]
MSIKVTDIAFVGYPVTELERARDFYERVLGLKCTLDHALEEDGKRWIEYDIGQSALAISNIWPPSGQSGPTAALEVDDLDGARETLQAEENVNVKSEVMESPGCRFFIIADPDGNDITIHQHKPH